MTAFENDAPAMTPTEVARANKDAASAKKDVADAQAPGISVGFPVCVFGLQGSPEYNGSKGLVKAGPFDNGRYEITITEVAKEGEGYNLGDKPPVLPAPEENQAPKVLSLKPANFKLDVEALQEYLVQKRLNKPKRNPPIEDKALVWVKGKGLSVKGITTVDGQVPNLESGQVLLRIDKFAFTHMTLGYLMKGYTRTFAAYHDFFKYPADDMYRGAMWGFCTVVESLHEKVAVGTRLYGLVPPCQYHVQKILRYVPANRDGDPALVEFEMDMPYKLRRYQEYEVIPENHFHDQEEEDWMIASKEIYTMAFYMDEQLLTDTGQINSVIISCASSKTAMALAFALRMRGQGVACECVMDRIVGLTSKEHLEFVKSTDLYHEVLTYDELEKIPTDRTVVYMDFKCDGVIRQALTLRLETNLMYNMVLGPSVFQKRMKDQLFEKRAREILFDESTWRERRRMVAEVTKTGRNEKLKYSYKSFVERVQKHMKLRHISDPESFKSMYDAIYSNKVNPDEVFICSMHPKEFAGEQLWED